MPKKVVIVDEQGFSRICSALLELRGCRAECRPLSVSAVDLHGADVGLVVTSYPYGEQLLKSLGGGELPVGFGRQSQRPPAEGAKRGAPCLLHGQARRL